MADSIQLQEGVETGFLDSRRFLYPFQTGYEKYFDFCDLHMMFVLEYYHKDLCVSQGGGRDKKLDIPGKRVGFSYPSSNYFLLENPKNRYYHFKGQANFFLETFLFEKIGGGG